MEADDVGEAPRPGLLAAEPPGFAQVRRRGRCIDRAAGGRLRRARELVVAGDALVDVLELRAARQAFLGYGVRTEEGRAERGQRSSRL
jgi:hypothetical protein